MKNYNDILEMNIYITGKVLLYKIFSKSKHPYQSLILDICKSSSINALQYGAKSCLRELLRTHLCSASKILKFQVKQHSNYEDCLIYIWNYLNTIHYEFFIKETIIINTYEKFKEIISDMYQQKYEIYIRMIDGDVPLNKLISILSYELEFEVLCMLNKTIINVNTKIFDGDILSFVYEHSYNKEMILPVRRLEHLLTALGIDIIKAEIGLPYSKNALLVLLNEEKVSYSAFENANMFLNKLTV